MMRHQRQPWPPQDGESVRPHRLSGPFAPGRCRGALDRPADPMPPAPPPLPADGSGPGPGARR
ncbi:hypothetical protein [Streptomyces fuscichromogenes]|uniref:hypothetical protein n=1 Tax=Streptomyces fuscichromogenes TaxID=1324013 RepID=UPI00166FA02E|nr:hypothetical protein [Streptomyces fuscichromogenes]